METGLDPHSFCVLFVGHCQAELSHVPMSPVPPGRAPEGQGGRGAAGAGHGWAQGAVNGFVCLFVWLQVPSEGGFDLPRAGAGLEPGWLSLLPFG